MSQEVFPSIDGTAEVTEIESMCVNCEENGMTRLFLTSIPHFREVVVMAFSCPHCGFSNNEVQSAGEIQTQGLLLTLQVNEEDLGRQVVKTASCSIALPALELEVPISQNQGNAVLTTVEGLIQRVRDDLDAQQPVRKVTSPETYDRIQEIIEELDAYRQGHAFELQLRDVSGNAFIENPLAPQQDPKLQVTHFERTPEENRFLGLANESVVDEVHEFPSQCNQCRVPNMTRMKLIEIPHFKEVVLMSTVCDQCGYKSNEVKAGGAISPKGRRITLQVTCEEDLSRDILKSETSGLSIPSIDLELGSGTLGGRFTTIEGILEDIQRELSGSTSFAAGDSADPERKKRFETFIQKLVQLKTSHDWTIILDDPMANSYIQNLYAPDPDPCMEVEDYERTQEQDDFFGVSDLQLDS